VVGYWPGSKSPRSCLSWPAEPVDAAGVIESNVPGPALTGEPTDGPARDRALHVLPPQLEDHTPGRAARAA
jgi:hypothetical protein